jgi:hypothetical protein
VNATSDAPKRFVSESIEPREWGRTSGYIASIVIDMILLYVVQHLVDWNVPWITPAWSDVVWAVNLSLTASIVANALLLAYDRPWFHRLVEVITTALALVTAYWIYLVFPFNFGCRGEGRWRPQRSWSWSLGEKGIPFTPDKETALSRRACDVAGAARVTNLSLSLTI